MEEPLSQSLLEIVQPYAGRKVSILFSTRIYHDLQLSGDDICEILMLVQKRFGTDFSGLDFKRYFPDETEAVWFYLAKKMGFTDDSRAVFTFGHLVEVVKRGEWFDPNGN